MPAGTVLEWAPGLTPDQYEAGGDRAPVPLAGAELPGPRFTPPGRELLVIDTDGVETQCATPDDAVAHIRTGMPGPSTVSRCASRRPSPYRWLEALELRVRRRYIESRFGGALICHRSSFLGHGPRGATEIALGRA